MLAGAGQRARVRGAHVWQAQGGAQRLAGGQRLAGWRRAGWRRAQQQEQGTRA